MKKKIISIIGTRGIPATYGGFETFAQELSIRLDSDKIKVVVFCDFKENNLTEYRGVQLKYSKYIKSEHPLLFYFDCILRAARDSDFILVAGTGGAFFYWIPKLARKIIITNIDGVESRRGKWGFFKKIFIKATEYIAIHCSDKVIADSFGIKNYVLQNYGVKDDRISVIEYGAEKNQGKANLKVLKKHDLIPNEYYLVVSRLEPENNIIKILQGFLASRSPRTLVIVGGLKKNSYVNQIEGIAQSSNGRIKLLGAIYERSELDALRFYTYAYMHGHSVGGTNPSLLEALAASNISICHDNEFNREVTESQMFYFKSSHDLALQLEEIEALSIETLNQRKAYALNRVSSYYNWDRITCEYRNLINGFVKQ